jgi:hypothetical protein
VFTVASRCWDIDHYWAALITDRPFESTTEGRTHFCWAEQREG